MKTFCFIPAKYGSTRLIKKNILKVNGKELIGYVIEAAKKSGIFNEIIVSTESNEIKEIAEKFGAECPYIRPEILSKDPYGVKDVLLDFLMRFEKFRNSYDCVFIILPTCPLLSTEDILNVKNKILNSSSKCVITITENDHSAYRSVVIKDESIQPIFKEYILKKSQELEKTYRINGAVVAVEINNFLKSKEIIQEKMTYSEMPRSRSIDIDEIDDLLLAEFMLKKNK